MNLEVQTLRVDQYSELSELFGFDTMCLATSCLIFRDTIHAAAVQIILFLHLELLFIEVILVRLQRTFLNK